MTVYAHPTLGMSDSIPISGSRAGQTITQQAHIYIDPAEITLGSSDVIRLLKIPAKHRVVDSLAFCDGMDNNNAITCSIRQWNTADNMNLSSLGIDLLANNGSTCYDWRGEEADRTVVLGAFSDNLYNQLTDIDSFIDVVIGIAPTAQVSGQVGVVVNYTPYDQRNAIEPNDPKNAVVFA